jgi:molybdopterin-guanine dinucleotide biosynthesis protein A
MEADPGNRIAAVILAGGRASRLGGVDKCLLPLGGRPILDHVLERLRGQVASILINANGDPARFAAWTLPIVPDVLPGQGGPLVGLLSALEWTRAQRPDCDWLLSVPGDGPFLPRDLLQRLWAARGSAMIVSAASGGWLNPVIALWNVRLAPALRRAIIEEGAARVDAWARRFPSVIVPVDGVGGVDPLFNINTADDLALAEAALEAGTCPD